MNDVFFDAYTVYYHFLSGNNKKFLTWDARKHIYTFQSLNLEAVGFSAFPSLALFLRHPAGVTLAHILLLVLFFPLTCHF